MGVGRRTKEEIVKWNQMTALRFQTGWRHQTSPASLHRTKNQGKVVLKEGFIGVEVWRECLKKKVVLEEGWSLISGLLSGVPLYVGTQLHTHTVSPAYG